LPTTAARPTRRSLSPPANAAGGWSRVAGGEGQEFSLRAFSLSGTRSLAKPGDWWVAAETAGFGGDELPATALLLRPDPKRFKPPATEEEIQASALQFVRKLSGFTRSSRANQLAFDRAVEQVGRAAKELLVALVTNTPPRYREVEAAKARARAVDRFRSDGSRAT
jgi:hypothetical protein